MKQYTQLNQEQRYQISGLHKVGWNQTQIADEIGVHKSTISREFSRNKGLRGWRPRQAQSMRDERRHACINGKQFSSNEWAEVDRLTRADLSLEQVANRLELEGSLQISPEIIYLHIYADKRNGGDLHQHLRSQKSRIGDWEGDTVIGKNHKGGLVTLAERVSRYVLAGHIRSKHAAGVTAVTTRLLKPHKKKCHTITFDNGKEFAEHETLAAALETNIYFAHPYRSWSMV